MLASACSSEPNHACCWSHCDRARSFACVHRFAARPLCRPLCIVQIWFHSCFHSNSLVKHFPSWLIKNCAAPWLTDWNPVDPLCCCRNMTMRLSTSPTEGLPETKPHSTEDAISPMRKLSLLSFKTTPLLDLASLVKLEASRSSSPISIKLFTVRIWKVSVSEK